jgi:glyoxylase-like metal-dependent hydrolase (beta-lactamase superfamily II)
MTDFQLSRRSFLRSTALTVPAVWLGLNTSVFAQDGAVPPMIVQARAAAAKAEIKIKGLRGNVSVLMGSGGNIAVLPGKEGFLMVDSGYLTSQPQITAALAPLGSGKVTTLVNTHWHFDHTDGNLWVHDQGATITAHTNTKKHLSERTEIKAFQVTLPPAPMGAVPTLVFDDRRTLKMNKATIELVHYAPAHTDSDISVRFVEANVLHCGDTLFSEGYPFIDYSTGGSIDGMIAATKKNLAMTDKSTQVIPGHGEVVDQAGLQAVLDMLQGSRGAVAAQKQQGKSLEETIAAKPTAAFDAKWGAGFVNPATFVTLVYQGV